MQTTPIAQSANTAMSDTIHRLEISYSGPLLG
jgi:hypothetical protein